ncbi:hypothetical protein FCX99_22240 [Escherichia coli]|nr:hypothetical protein [Escherichia coli]EFH7885860.1 hypothetical protein [Escherichia coli]MDN0536751.1 hypothetical protein [Escherichia coli]MDN0569389.1 hypothetical protein [Escherichia coli]MDN0588729.1 hypothetical protein [Escherichia coli]
MSRVIRPVALRARRIPVVRKASWHCRQCHHDYYGERYCTHCQTGGFSIPRTTQEEICEF